ncbi:hypothetical protein K438DRAFT_1856572 [Mycena galopus ATCC 62051]|nr:hypothetical protein K438DRAFT_1856572 [Mycena galopus ATCC 62051]
MCIVGRPCAVGRSHRALYALFPDWRSKYPDLSLAQPVASSGMCLLTDQYSIPIPHPPQMNSKGNYIGACRVAA